MQNVSMHLYTQSICSNTLWQFASAWGRNDFLNRMVLSVKRYYLAALRLLIICESRFGGNRLLRQLIMVSLIWQQKLDWLSVFIILAKKWNWLCPFMASVNLCNFCVNWLDVKTALKYCLYAAPQTALNVALFFGAITSVCSFLRMLPSKKRLTSEEKF